MKYLGAHLGGGLKNIEEISNKYSINTIQYMPTAPMRWSSKPIPDTNVVDFADMLSRTPIQKVLLHGIYLINLARADNQMFHLSKISLTTYLDYSEKLEELLKKNKAEVEILGTCFHPGSAKDLSESEGLKRVIEGINWVLENSKGGLLLLESTAGAGFVMGDTFEELTKMREGVEQKERVGYVIDTQHTYVSGYDWVNDLDGVVRQIENTIGLKNVKAIHLNDSIPPLGSHKDRHANIGDGMIGLEGIKKIVNHPKLSAIPFILETPAIKSADGVGKELNKIA